MRALNSYLLRMRRNRDITRIPLVVCKGIFFVFLTVIFPFAQSTSKATYDQRADLLSKQEEMLKKLCYTTSFTLSIFDEMRSCLYMSKCGGAGEYKEMCDVVVSSGTLKLASAEDTYDSVSKIASVYFSDELGGVLDDYSKEMDVLLNIPLAECNMEDEQYRKSFDDVQEVLYPKIVSGMHKEIIASRAKLNNRWLDVWEK